MNKYKLSPTPRFWDCLGVALVFLAGSVAWSLIKSEGYKMGTASHQIEVYRKIERAKKVNQETVEKVRKAPMNPKAKKETLRQLEESQGLLEETSEDLIESQSELLEGDRAFTN